jgi:hypothetical protein
LWGWVLIRGFGTDIKDSEVPPRWPPVLSKGSFANPTWELVAIDATSISFVVNRILKVSDVSATLNSPDSHNQRIPGLSL